MSRDENAYTIKEQVLVRFYEFSEKGGLIIDENLHGPVFNSEKAISHLKEKRKELTSRLGFYNSLEPLGIDINVLREDTQYDLFIAAGFKPSLDFDYKSFPLIPITNS